MSQPDTLTRLSIATFVSNHNKIMVRFRKSEGQERLKLWHCLQNIQKILRTWTLPNSINSSLTSTDLNIHPEQLSLENVNSEVQLSTKPWEVCEILVKDIRDELSDAKVTTVVSFKNLHEFHRFKAFLRHLVCNWFEKIKVEKLYANNAGFLVTHPAPALLYLNSDTSSNSTELSNSSKHEATNAIKVMKVLKEVMKDDFYLTSLSDKDVDAKSLVGKSNVDERGFNPLNRTVFVFHDDISLSFLKPQRYSLAFQSSEDQSSQTATHVKTEETGNEGWKNERTNTKGTKSEETDPIIDELGVENVQLRETIRCLIDENVRAEANYRKAAKELESKNNELTMQLTSLRNEFEKKQEELDETLLDLGRVSVQATRLTNEKKKGSTLRERRNNTTVSTQTLQRATSLQQTVFPPCTGAEGGLTMNPNSQSHDRDIEGHSEIYPADVSVQESSKVSSNTGGASLTNIPTNVIERSLYNNYRLLLLIISDLLLSTDVAMLKTWARTKFATDHFVDINEVFRDLDQKKVIGPSDLVQLREFFEGIGRIDLIYLIDHFLLGNYGRLRTMNCHQRTVRGGGSRAASAQGINGDSRAASDQGADGGSRVVSDQGTEGGSRVVSAQAGADGGSRVASAQGTGGGSRAASVQGADGGSIIVSAQGTEGGSGVVSAQGAEGGSRAASVQGADGDSRVASCAQETRGGSRFASAQGTGGGSRVASAQGTGGGSRVASAQGTEGGSRAVRAQGTEGGSTVVSVQGEYGGSRVASTHGTGYSRSASAQTTEGGSRSASAQGTGGGSRSAIGIYRIHEHRSFHCDTCGVCLDVQLGDNHRSHEVSARDECCICHQDAIGGCQILPCYHKVHEECVAFQMIHNGITKCPVCRVSFTTMQETGY